VRDADANDPMVLDPRIVKQAPLWKQGERRLATEQVWDRLRREPDLPFMLKPTDHRSAPISSRRCPVKMSSLTVAP